MFDEFNYLPRLSYMSKVHANDASAAVMQENLPDSGGANLTPAFSRVI